MKEDIVNRKKDSWRSDLDAVSFRRPGGAGAAETFELRQVREEAAIRRYLWVPPGTLPGHFY